MFQFLLCYVSILNVNNKSQRVAISASLLACDPFDCQPFLSHIVINDEKWHLYVNFKQRKEWLSPDKQAIPRPKADLVHARQCCAYDMTKKASSTTDYFRRIRPSLHNFIVNSFGDLTQRFKKFDRRLQVILQRDNFRPYTAKMM